METDAEPWIVVVEPTEAAIAERAFDQWKRAHPSWSAQLSDIDIRIDTIRGSDGATLRRYRVRNLPP